MKMLLYIWKVNFLSLIEYKLSFIFLVVAMIVNNTLFALVWYFIFLKFGTIGNMNIGDYMTLLSIVTMIFGLVHVFFGGLPLISAFISEGKLDSYLLLPRNILVRLLTDRMSASAIGDIVYSFMLMLFIPQADIITVFKIIIFAICGSATFIGFLLIFNSLAFFLGNSKNISKAALESLLGPSHYPPGLFEGTFLKIAFMTILPVYFLTYLPFGLVTDFSWIGFLELIAGSSFFLGLGILVFYAGLKRYESGNMMNVNI